MGFLLISNDKKLRAMQYQNIAINGPYIGLFLTFVHIGSNRAHKIGISN